MPTEIQKPKAVVTGGAGFIGSHLARELLREGYNVYVVDNLLSGFKERVPNEAQFVELDIRETDALKSVFDGAHVVFHCAAMPKVQDSMERPEVTHDANVNGTLSVLEAAQAAGVGRVVYSASSSAYGDAVIMPLSEDMLVNPKSPYALQKYVGELHSRLWSEAHDLPTVSLRYFNVYGPGMNPGDAYAAVMGIFLQRAKEGKPLTITGDGEQTRDFVHVSDVVRANMLAAQSPKVGKGEVINIGSGNNVSIKYLAQCIGGPIEFVEPRVEPRDSLAAIHKARTLLGWEPRVRFEEGIDELKQLWAIK